MSQFSSDTSGRSLKGWALALLVLFGGLVVAHLGITLFLQAAMGSDPFTVMVQGLARAAGLSVGTVHVVISCGLMALMLLFTKGYVKPGTVICAFFGGPIIDFFSYFLAPVLNEASPLPLRLVGIVVGCVILALGMSIVINSDAGTGPNDLVAMILTDRLSRFPFSRVRMACDLTFFLAGLLLGGTVGLGTLAAVFLVGPCAQLWLPLTRKLIPQYEGKEG